MEIWLHISLRSLFSHESPRELIRTIKCRWVGSLLRAIIFLVSSWHPLCKTTTTSFCLRARRGRTWWLKWAQSFFVATRDQRQCRSLLSHDAKSIPTLIWKLYIVGQDAFIEPETWTRFDAQKGVQPHMWDVVWSSEKIWGVEHFLNAYADMRAHSRMCA